MPVRFVERAARHVARHPWRVAGTLAALLALSFLLLGASIVRNFEAGHRARVENCRSINELSREIYVFLGEVNVPDYQRDKFLPTTDCESLP